MWQKILNLFKKLEDISDGFHTFADLYKIRHILCLALAQLAMLKGVKVFKSTLHGDETEMYGGYFILVIETPQGQISFHMPLEYWDYLPNIVEKYDWSFDGHTYIEVYQRILLWVVDLAND